MEKSRLIGFLDATLPPALRGRLPARMLVACAWLTLSFSGPMAAARALGGTPMGTLLPLFVALGIGLITMGLLWTSGVEASGIVYFSAMSLVIPAVTLFGNGEGSYTLPCVCVVPVCATMVLGPAVGRITLGVVTVSLVCMAVAEAAGLLRFVPSDGRASSEIFTICATLATVWMLAAVSMMYLGDQSQAAQALRSEQARLALAVRATGAGVAQWTGGLDEAFASPALREMLGLSSPVTGTEALLAAVVLADRAALLRLLDATMRGERQQGRVETAIELDGQPRRLLAWSVLGERGADGHRHLVAMVEDVSESRRVSRMKDDFVGIVNHELRTPLTNLVGAVRLLRAGVAGPLVPEQARLIELAVRNGEQLTELIQNLLDLQRLGDGELQVEFNSVELVALVREVSDLLADFAHQRGVEVVVTGLSAVRVPTDARRVGQVVHQLIHNAIKFAPERSNITVRITEVRGVARLEVQDRGPGIPSPFQPHVFERFSQPWDTRSRPYGGSGLGLNLVRGLTERLGGRVGFVSMSGHGSTFWFELPLSRGQVVAA